MPVHRVRRGGGARRTQPRGPGPRILDNSPYLNRRQHARKVGDSMTADTAPQQPDPDKPCIVVGIVADQPAEVLQTAATFAERFAARLVLAHGDDARDTTEVRPDGEDVSMPIHTDLITDRTSQHRSEALD